MARDKDSLQKRLSKARGQIEAIKKMIDKEDDAERILVQINAAKSALHKVGLIVEKEAISQMLNDKDKEKAAVILERFSSLD